MLRSILLALAFSAGVSSAAQAQQARVVAACGTQALRVNDGTGQFIDSTGNLCTSATSAGGSSVVSGSSNTDVRATGTLAAATVGSQITIPVNGQSTLGFTFTGLATSGATVSYFQSNDGGTTYTQVNEFNPGTGQASGTRTTDGQSRIATQGRTNIRIQVTTAGTGTITVATNLSIREGLIAVDAPVPGIAANSGAIGPVPAISTTSSLVAKASAGNLYGYSFTQGATAGYFAFLNATAAPAASAAISPLECVPVAANSYVRARQDIPDRFTTGITIVSTSSCTTYTAVTPQLIEALVQ